jgi:hypothetical protein
LLTVVYGYAFRIIAQHPHQEKLLQYL